MHYLESTTRNSIIFQREVLITERIVWHRNMPTKMKQIQSISVILNHTAKILNLMSYIMLKVFFFLIYSRMPYYIKNKRIDFYITWHFMCFDRVHFALSNHNVFRQHKCIKICILKMKRFLANSFNSP